MKRRTYLKIKKYLGDIDVSDKIVSLMIWNDRQLVKASSGLSVLGNVSIVSP